MNPQCSTSGTPELVPSACAAPPAATPTTLPSDIRCHAVDHSPYRTRRLHTRHNHVCVRRSPPGLVHVRSTTATNVPLGSSVITSNVTPGDHATVAPPAPPPDTALFAETTSATSADGDTPPAARRRSFLWRAWQPACTPGNATGGQSPNATGVDGHNLPEVTCVPTTGVFGSFVGNGNGRCTHKSRTTANGCRTTHNTSFTEDNHPSDQSPSGGVIVCEQRRGWPQRWSTHEGRSPWPHRRPHHSWAGRHTQPVTSGLCTHVPPLDPITRTLWGGDRGNM